MELVLKPKKTITVRPNLLTTNSNFMVDGKIN